MKKILIFALPIFLLFSCVTSIEDLKNRPSKYVGEIVPVKGSISKAIPIPFTEFSIFELKDQTGNIVLFSVSDFKVGDEVKLQTKVIGFDSTNQEKSLQQIIVDIKEFILLNSDIKNEKVESVSETISKTITTIVKPVSGTYFLIDKTGVE